MSCLFCQYSSAFGLSLTFYSFYLGYPGGHLLGKSCRLVFILCRLYCMCFFLVWCLGEDAELDCIAS